MEKSLALGTRRYPRAESRRWGWGRLRGQRGFARLPLPKIVSINTNEGKPKCLIQSLLGKAEGDTPFLQLGSQRPPEITI